MVKSIKISERDFSTQVEDLLNIYHWRWAHFRPARTMKGWRTALSGYKGFPDYIAVRPPRLIFSELKDEYSEPSPEQEAWLEDFRSCRLAVVNQPLEVEGNKTILPFGLHLIPAVIINPEVYLWRPKDIDQITLILR